MDRRQIQIEGNKTQQSERLDREAKNRLMQNQSPAGKSSAEQQRQNKNHRENSIGAG
jgi:hypothetical protein